MLKKSIYLIIIHVLIASWAISAESNAARVKFTIGEVQLLPDQKTDWQSLKLNMEVFSGDRIRTTLNARVELEMPDGTIVKVNENSIFDVTEIKTPEEDQEDKMSFTLWAGNIWASFKKIVSGRQTREIQSPSAVVAIRGTILEMDVDINQSTTVRVEEGRVSVVSKEAGGEVFVNGNEETVVERGKQPIRPREIRKQLQQQDPGAFVFQIQASQLQYTEPSVLINGITVSGRTGKNARVSANGIPLLVAGNGNFKGEVRVQEGLNEIRIDAEAAGQKQSKTMRLFVNTKKPRIQLSQPITSRFVNRRDYSLSGAVFDPTPMDRVKVYLNQELVTEVAGRGSFNRTVILKEGKNNIRVRAVDRSKNTAEINEQIFLDTVKPIVTLTEPAKEVSIQFKPPRPPSNINNIAAERFRQYIRGLIIDPEPSSRIKRISINGKDIKPNADGSFELLINLKRGENRISIYAEDLAGNIYRDESKKIIVR